MFQEYKDIVDKLKTEDANFSRLITKHNELHDEIEKAEAGDLDHMDPIYIEKMKKEKLKFKDQAYSILVKYKKENKL